MNISECWLVNLVNEPLEVHRNPIADRVNLQESYYDETTICSRGQIISPVTRRRGKIKVADLLP